MYYDDASDAAADAYDDAREDAITNQLALLVDPIVEKIEALYSAREDGGLIDNAHPWTWDRCLLWAYDEDGEDGLREFLDEELRDEAEQAANDDAYDSGPCCDQFSCPCGGAYYSR